MNGAHGRTFNRAKAVLRPGLPKLQWCRKQSLDLTTRTIPLWCNVHLVETLVLVRRNDEQGYERIGSLYCTYWGLHYELYVRVCVLWRDLHLQIGGLGAHQSGWG